MPETDELTQAFADDQAENQEPVEEELPPEAAEAQEPEVQAETPPQEDSWVTVGGLQVRSSELEPYVKFMQWANVHPDGWEALADLEQLADEQGWDTVRNRIRTDQPQTQSPAEDDVWVDPEVKALRATVDEYRAEVDELRGYLSTREGQEVRTTVDDGLDTFRRSHSDISDADWQRVLQRVADYRLIEREREKDPARPQQAIQKALDAAYRMEFYEQSSRAGGAQALKDVKNRRRAAAASGSQTSASRVPPEPQTKAEKLSAFAQAWKEAQSEDAG